ncbi:MAG: maleylpyruvate isomerase N-terminal domain-containing protein [Actinobacteria bacterium]|jgi:uncharacterized protein (TIGR03083 family)|nr:maleylpyruvate isomerase N-terminal domain-containing protein [Actinomycetota bacterium]
MDHNPGNSVRNNFYASADAFSALVSQIPPDSWEKTALGVWNLRDLVGHTSRALLTIESYLGKPSTGPDLLSAFDYFAAVKNTAGSAEEVAQRGREAGNNLLPNPASSVSNIVTRVKDLVEGNTDDTTVGTPWGTMTLERYLPTRTFELTVHSLDISRTLGVATPSNLGPSISESLELIGKLASLHAEADELLLMLTGRPNHLKTTCVV